MGKLRVVAEAAMLAFGVVALAYNILMMLNSDEGLAAKAELETEILERRQMIASLEEEHAFLSRRADALLTGQLDEDLLEERVRVVLGLVRPDEYLVRMEDLDRLAEKNAARQEAARLAAAQEEEERRLAEAGREDEGLELVRYAALPIELLQ